MEEEVEDGFVAGLYVVEMGNIELVDTGACDVQPMMTQLWGRGWQDYSTEEES